MNSIYNYSCYPLYTASKSKWYVYWILVYFPAQCPNYISTVGLHIINSHWKIMLMEPVMIPVPVYWSQGYLWTQQLLSALLQILWIPKIQPVELFPFLSFFCCGHYDCDRNLARQKKWWKLRKLRNPTRQLKRTLFPIIQNCNWTKFHTNDYNHNVI